MTVDLSGFKVLVTGASRGIGKAIAEQLGASGAIVALHYFKHAAEAERLAKDIGNGSVAVGADLSVPTEVKALSDKVIGLLGGLDILVNNAGIAEGVQMESPDDRWLESWNKTIMVNLTAASLLCKTTLPHFTKMGTGRIINVSSRAAFRGDTPEYLAYAASKAGLVSVTRTIARAYGKRGVKAFLIAPGFVKTDMAMDFIDEYGEDHVKSDVALEQLTEPKDVAPLVTFLASGMADHATGGTFDINAASYVH